MNRERRTDIASAIELIEAAKAILEGCREGEQDYFDNMPESFKGSEKGEAAYNVTATLDDAIYNLDDAISSASDAIA